MTLTPKFIARFDLWIFDLDGTLVDSFADIAASCNYVRRQMNLPDLSHATIEGFIGKGVVRLLEDVLETQDKATIERALQMHQVHYGEHLLDTTRLFPEIPAMLEALRGKQLAILSNKSKAFSEKILRGLGVHAQFKWIVGGDNPFGRKPDPAALIWIARQAGIPLSRTCLIGDSDIDAETGKNAGVETVIVKWGKSN